MKGDKGLSTRVKPKNPEKGALDSRKLTVRLYPPQMNLLVDAADQLGLTNTEAARELLEFAIAQVQKYGIEVLGKKMD